MNVIDITSRIGMAINGNGNDSDYTHVPPKSEARSHRAHRYTLRFDPNAPPSERWFWTVRYTRTYEYVGSSPTIDQAAEAAKRRINELINRDGHLV